MVGTGAQKNFVIISSAIKTAYSGDLKNKINLLEMSNFTLALL